MVASGVDKDEENGINIIDFANLKENKHSRKKLKPTFDIICFFFFSFVQ